MRRRKKGEGFPRACRQRLARGDQRFYSIQTESGIKRVYLGLWDDKASEEKYNFHKDYWEKTGKFYHFEEPIENPTVRDLSLKYLKYLTYEKKLKKRALEIYVYSLRHLCQHYGNWPVNDFHGKDLEKYRRILINENKYCRKTINKRIVIIRSAFKWGAFEEFVTYETLTTLTSLTFLKKDEEGTVDNPPVVSVPREIVEATLPFLPTVVADMVQVQLDSGARPSEIREMREIDIIKFRSDLWIYIPLHDKTESKRADFDKRKVRFGPRSIKLIRRNFTKNKEDYVFRPEEAAKEAQKRASERLKELYPKSVKSKGKKAETTKKYKPFYSNWSYLTAIRRACDRAGVPHWHPYQLRHLRCTEIEEKYGIRVAQILLGHKCLNTTLVYLDEDSKRIEEIIRKEG